MHRGQIALGPGKADLLEAIRSEGSISGGARRLGMSYRRAWLLVQAMNSGFRDPVVATAGRRGWRGGGAEVTATGLRILALYRAMEKESLAATRKARRALSNLLR